MSDGKLEQLYEDYYIGNGKPSMRTRMEVMEERVDGMKESLDKANKALSRLTFLILGVLLTVVGEAVMRGIGK